MNKHLLVVHITKGAGIPSFNTGVWSTYFLFSMIFDQALIFFFGKFIFHDDFS